MKRLVSLSVALVLSAVSALTANAQMKGMDMNDMQKGMDSAKSVQGTVHKGNGIVKKVDDAKGTVTVDHEPIKSANWSAMTMTFNVKDKKMLENVKTGQKVQFEFVQQGKENVITSIK